MTKLERNIETAQEYLEKIIGTRYSWWTGGAVPDGAPAWARNGEPPSPANVKGTSCFCAGVTNLARRAVGLEIPTLGNPNYDGGIVAYFGATEAAPAGFPRKGYFEKQGKLRRFNLQDARRPWTLIGRKYRNVRDQGHVAIVMPDGKVLQSYDAGGGRPGINKNATLEQSHDGGYYEVMVYAEDWLLPPGAKGHELVPPDKPPEREEEVPLFTAKQLIEMAENSNLAPATAEKYREALIPEMREAGVTTPLRMAAFFGNVMVETDRLNTLEEYGDRNYWMYLDRNSGRAGEWRYHGRGFLQNTWRSAYANLSRVLDVDLVSDPDLLEQPKYAAKAAMWFWKQHNLNAYADKGNFKAVASTINTGRADRTPNHWEQRLHFYDVAKRVLARGPGAAGKGLAREEFDRNGFNRDGLPYINLAAVGQADETAAFALATEIRRAGIGVTVTSGAESVYALAKKMRSERLGYRQLWILGEPALEACGEFAELANWPISQKTDYYNLAGKDFTGSCRRAAELADEKAKEGVGRRFLEEISAARQKPPLAKPLPPQDEAAEPEEDGRREKEEERRGRGRREERARDSKEDGDQLETITDARDEQETGQEPRGKREERHRDGRDDLHGTESIERFTDEELEEIGREIVRLFSRIRKSRSPGDESDAYSEKEDY